MLKENVDLKTPGNTRRAVEGPPRIGFWGFQCSPLGLGVSPPPSSHSGSPTFLKKIPPRQSCCRPQAQFIYTVCACVGIAWLCLENGASLGNASTEWHTMQALKGLRHPGADLRSGTSWCRSRAACPLSSRRGTAGPTPPSRCGGPTASPPRGAARPASSRRTWTAC